MKIDFYKTFSLVPPMCGLISKLIKGKGKRTLNEEGIYEYSLPEETVLVYEGKELELSDGLYHVFDLCSVKNKATWCHYLFIIDGDKCYPIYEALSQKDSSWVKQAVVLVKNFYAGEPLKKIELTKIDYELIVEKSWNTHNKFNSKK